MHRGGGPKRSPAVPQISTGPVRRAVALLRTHLLSRRSHLFMLVDGQAARDVTVAGVEQGDGIGHIGIYCARSCRDIVCAACRRAGGMLSAARPGGHGATCE